MQRKRNMSQISISDILALLKEDWIPDAKKKQIQAMILDSIDMAEEMTKIMKESTYGKPGQPMGGK